MSASSPYKRSLRSVNTNVKNTNVNNTTLKRSKINGCGRAPQKHIVYQENGKHILDVIEEKQACVGDLVEIVGNNLPSGEIYRVIEDENGIMDVTRVSDAIDIMTHNASHANQQASQERSSSPLFTEAQRNRFGGRRFHTARKSHKSHKSRKSHKSHKAHKAHKSRKSRK